MIFFVIQEVRPYVRKVFRGVQSAPFVLGNTKK